MPLAFVAWQTSRAYPEVNPLKIDLDKDAQTESATVFRSWWDRAQSDSNWVLDHWEIGFSSIRTMCWLAWAAARQVNEPNHGWYHHFESWWATIVAAQPVIGEAKP